MDFVKRQYKKLHYQFQSMVENYYYLLKHYYFLNDIDDNQGIFKILTYVINCHEQRIVRMINTNICNQISS